MLSLLPIATFCLYKSAYATFMYYKYTQGVFSCAVPQAGFIIKAVFTNAGYQTLMGIC